MAALRARLVEATDQSTWNHRPFMSEQVKHMFPHMLEDEQLQYARFKLAVAKVLQPRTIYEVGIGWGVSCTAFMAGKPDALFFGIDNGEMGVDPGSVTYFPIKHQVIASDQLPAFVHPDGQIDLIHIDGGHNREQKARDIVKAFEARPEWILVDDVHDVMVAAGTFDGIWKAAANGLSMLYFENSHTGNLLIHAARKAPEYRD
jgi:hypothetical protein